MNPTLPPEASARLQSVTEIRALLHVARSQGYAVIPDPDRRGIAVVLPKGRAKVALGGAILHLVYREREVFDYLMFLQNLASAVVAESLPSPGESIPEGVPVSAPAHDQAVTPARAPSIPHRLPDRVIPPPEPWPNPPGPGATPMEERAHWYKQEIRAGRMTPNKVRRLEGLAPIPGGDVLRPCPACDPGHPCLDHGAVPEQVPPPLPRWMRGVIVGLLAVLTVAVCCLLLTGGGQ